MTFETAVGSPVEKSGTAKSGLDYRKELDGIRSIALLSVIMFHLGFSDWTGGFIGVDIFFVLSGFLICGQIFLELESGAFSATQFFARRIRRLSTAFFICYSVIAIAAYFFLLPFELPNIIYNLLGSTTFTNNFVLMGETGYFAPGAEINPFIHTWSLSIEEQFYIALPLLVLATRKSTSYFKMLLVYSFAISLGVVLFSGDVIYNDEQRYFSSLMHVWELAIGGLTFILIYQRRKLFHFPFAPFIGIMAITFPVFIMTAQTLQPGPWALLPTFGTVLLLATCSPITSITGRVLASRVPAYLGRISYGSYLWHWPLIVFYNYLGGDLNDVKRAIFLLVSLAFGAASYHFVERPIRRISAVTNKRRLLLLFGIQTVILLALVGALGIRSQSASPANLARFSKVIAEQGVKDPRWAKCWFSKRPQEPCKVGVAPATDAADMLFWGDSMVNSAIPAIEAFALERNLTAVVTPSPSCPPLLGVSRQQSRAEKCLAANDAVAKYLDSAPPMDVYLFARWSFYAEGYRNNRTDKIGDVGFVDSRLQRIERPDLDVFRAALEKTLDRISPRHTVILVGEAPQFPYSVPFEMIKTLRFGGDMAQLTWKQYLARSGRTEEMLRTIAAKRGLLFLDTAAALCNDVLCPASINGIPLYADHVHLSGEGNRVFLDVLRQVPKER